MSLTSGNASSSLAKFAFNIYGTLNNSTSNLSPQSTSSTETRGSSNTSSTAHSYNNNPANLTATARKLHYTSDRDISSISQLNFPIQAHEQSSVHHVVIGGRNCLKLLSLNADQTKIVNELNILDHSANSTSGSGGGSPASVFASNSPYSSNSYSTARGAKLVNVNTTKAKYDTIACGLSNGGIYIYKIQNNGKSTLAYKLTNHKRTINSLDFLNMSLPEDTNQFISGSQDGTIKLWDLRTSSVKPMMNIATGSHSDPIRSCEYSQHSSTRNNKITILSVHDSGALYKYDLRSTQQQNAHQPLGGGNYGAGGGGAGAGGAVAIIPERKWNFHTGPALSLHIHPEKEYVITGGRDQKLCVWNYGDNEYRLLPEIIVNSYGPILKVRWSLYPTALKNTGSYMSDELDYTITDRDDPEDVYSKNPLYNYDIACTYLNEDPTITVYNLKRKYIPKEIITTTSSKPFQNFIWGAHPKRTRNIWTITKANQFTSYSLDRARAAIDSEIIKPLDNLRNISVGWSHSMGDFTFINQEKYEFQNLEGDLQQQADQQLQLQQLQLQPVLQEKEDYEMDLAMSIEGGMTGSDAGILIDEMEKEREPLASPIGIVPIATNNNSPINFHSNLPSSYLSVQEIKRAGGAGILAAPSNNNISANNPISTVSSSVNSGNLKQQLSTPVPHRPALNRNATQESIVSAAASSPLQSTQNQFHSLLLLQQLQQIQQLQQTKRILSVMYPSPYLVPISLPVQLNDESVFETLSFHYLISIPDGFTLIDACILNANVAASVNKFRECQVWRVLAVSLEEEGISRGTFDNLGREKDDDEIVNRLDSVSTYLYSSGKGEGGRIEGEKDREEDNRSILLELDNFVGSFNSNSTLNYGGTDIGSSGANIDGNNSSPEKASSIKKVASRKDGSFSEQKNSSTGNLKDMINNSRGAFPNSISPMATRSNSMLAMNNKGLQIFRNRNDENENEDAIVDDDDEGMTISARQPSEQIKKVKSKERQEGEIVEDDDLPLKKQTSLPVLSASKDEDMVPEMSASPPIRIETSAMHRYGEMNSSPNRGAIGKSNTRFSFGTGKRPAAEDLDDENMNILHAAGYGTSVSSSGKSMAGSPTFFGNMPHSSSHSHHSQLLHHGSFNSRRNSNLFGNRMTTGSGGGVKNSISFTSLPKEEALNRVQEQDEMSQLSTSAGRESVNVPSQLTNAFHREEEEIRLQNESTKASASLFKPWTTKNLLEEALSYADLQGDILMCSTLALLFYDPVLKSKRSSVSKENCIEWLALYIEILRRKQLFVTAMKVLNETPSGLSADLNRICGNEVSLRFYCNWCKKLLVNEESKVKFNSRKWTSQYGTVEDSSDFGYWYCDECSKQQLGCVYCNEPCKGLNVVVSLKCGHRGHFGCLREWFVEDENTECPGGCDVSII